MKRLILTALLLAAGLSAASAQEGLAAGEASFRKCMGCHAVGENARNRAGPVLNDLFGRVAGTLEGYAYSPAMKTEGEEGLAWDHETLETFLANPRQAVPGTKMAFAGIRDETELANLLAYLQTFSPDYVPEDEAAAPAP